MGTPSVRWVPGSEMVHFAWQNFLRSSAGRQFLQGDAISALVRGSHLGGSCLVHSLGSHAAVVPNTTETWVAAPPARFRRVW